MIASMKLQVENVRINVNIYVCVKKASQNALISYFDIDFSE